MTVTMAEKAATEPTERSKSAEARQNIMPQATMPVEVMDCRRLERLKEDKNRGMKREQAVKRTR
jgi:hypothetical protein